jgi:hypothetical protein
MAVVELTMKKGTAKGGWDALWRRTYSRTYVVVCDSYQDTEYTLRLADDGFGNLLLPRPGYPFREIRSWLPGGAVTTSGIIDVGAFCQGANYAEVSVNASPNHRQWEVEVPYGPFDAGTFGSNPTSWPLQITNIGGTRFEKTLFEDPNSGDAILNSAGQPFENPATADDSRVSFTIVRNELVSTFGLDVPATYNDTTNLNPWNGFAAKTAKFGVISAEGPYLDSNNQVYYMKVSYPVEVARTDWMYHPLDEGFSYLSSGNPIRFRTYDGQDTPEPHLLNGSGAPWVSGPAIFLDFDKYVAVDWGPLGIDLSTRLGA